MMLAKSLQSAAGNAAAEANYIESVFQTWLYTGNGSTQTITNGIDLAGEGGLVWIKQRSATRDNLLFDTTRGATQRLFSNLTLAQSQDTQSLTAFNSDGFSIGSDSGCNISAGTYASWTFRKQPKFFDVVTFTGNSTSGRQISHSLGSAPGCIIVKNLTNADEWLVWHRSLGDFGGAGKNLVLNSTAAVDTGGYFGTAANQTSTYFTVNADTTKINWSGNTYVAYLFAHDSGGFGLSGEDNVISCGSYTGNGSTSGPTVTLGYEPQWVMIKQTSAAGESWYISDTMRQSNVGTDVAALAANESSAENTATGLGKIITTATGFYPGTTNSAFNSNGSTYIYIAIRRGPMKVPESGTSVFSPNAVSTDASPVTTNFPVDLSFESPRSGSSNIFAQDRLRGANKILYTYSTNAESTAGGSASNFQSNTSVEPLIYGSGTSLIFWNFRRAPSVFDVVCYTGTGSNTTQAHNLQAVPEMMIVKQRGAAGTGWLVYHKDVGATKYLNLNTTAASVTLSTIWNNTAPTVSVFSLGTNTTGNASGGTYVAYLFASCPGVSKVGSYTGNGSTQTIDCGFTGGARFVLIKRTSGTGDWYVWDSARGIVAGNDPYLLLNSTAAEVTSTDYVDTYSAGFEISSTAPAAINASGGTFIFLAIA